VQIGQKARVLIEAFAMSKAEPIGDDRAMILRFDDATRKGTMRSCQVRLNLAALDNEQDRVWDGVASEQVIGDCKTAVVIITSIPEKDIMYLMEQFFQSLLPGGRVGR